jgi:hypothetical protein
MEIKGEKEKKKGCMRQTKNQFGTHIVPGRKGSRDKLNAGLKAIV